MNSSDTHTAEALINKRLDVWAEHLLDTSKRNRLLYFNPAPTSTIHLTEPDLLTIWNRLVVKGKAQRFYDLQDDTLFDDDLESDDEDSAPVRALKTDELRTQPKSTQLGRTLYSLRQKAKTSLEEQGVVTLFAAFGLLKWQEAAKPNEDIFSPLILAPMTLLRASLRDPYTLKLWEEEPVINPALRFKLNGEAKIELPELPSLDDLELVDYFRETEKACAPRGWRVLESAYLGLFSFHKLAMYRDLCDNRDVALKHWAVRALGGDLLSTPPTTILLSGRELDGISPDDTWQTLDADSSQQEAILAARRGASFVLQGPPGTGKSQTITNIIAECLAEGKKVLFVSEKMAALQVVYQRLCNSGLRDFCLEAHSHKANKREVVQELGRALAANSKVPGAANATTADLAALRRSLNDYVDQLHAVRVPSQLSAFAVYSELAVLQNAPDCPFRFEDALQVVPTQRAQIIEYLHELVRLHEVLLTEAAHPWRGTTLRDAGLNTQSDLRFQFDSAQTACSELENALRAAMKTLDVERFVSLDNCNRIAELAELLLGPPQSAPSLPRSWIENTDLSALENVAREQAVRQAEYSACRNSLLEKFHNTILALPHQELKMRLTQRPQQALFERIDSKGAPRAAFILSERDALKNHFARSLEQIAELQSAAQVFASLLNLPVPKNIEDALAISKTGAIVVQFQYPQPHWLAIRQTTNVRSAIDEAKLQQQAISTARAALNDYDLPRLLELSPAELLTRFESSYSGALRILRPDFHRDMKSLRAVYRPAEKATPEIFARDLKIVVDLQNHENLWQQSQEARAHEFGEHYQSEKTDWSALERDLELCDELNAQLSGSLPSQFIEAVCNRQIRGEVSTRTARLQTAISTLHDELSTLNTLIPLRDFPGSSAPLPLLPFNSLRDFLDNAKKAFNDFLDAYDTVAGCMSGGMSNFEEVLRALDTAQQLIAADTQFESDTPQLRAQFANFFASRSTPWDKVLATLAWAQETKKWFGHTPIPATVLGFLTQDNTAQRAQLQSEVAALRAAHGKIEHHLPFTKSILPSWHIDGRPPEHADLNDLRSWFVAQLQAVPQLEEWIAFAHLREKMEACGLGSFLQFAQLVKLEANELLPSFHQRFWLLWLDEALRDSPALARFSSDTHETRIAQFRAADAQILNDAQQRLQMQLHKSKPSSGLGSARAGELAFLQREVVKKARHKPLRQLFSDIPNLLQALKPCLLMSPLSVAQFLPVGKVSFDVVVFDEASQICSEDAIGAIMRSAQVIVVGDRKQLPPTKFFTGASLDLDEDDEGESGEIYESILDECSTIGLPGKMLRWHYRSRKEELIAFSNRHFYESNLVTFPEPIMAALKTGIDDAVEFERVNGTYIRGKSKNARTNPLEAQRVAEMALAHFESNPHLSLGVIAFNEAQATAILRLVESLARQKPHLEPLLSDQRAEPFFVKNLENVQGDERDVIFFSVGYGPEESGKFSMNFGPLNRAGGERRLNVAVTRARLRNKIVASFDPHQIELARTSARGVALLRAYLEFAQSGAVASPAITLPSSPEAMKDAIAQALEARGWDVRRNIGLSEMQIDLAVENPQRAGEFLLGIECDGSTYAAPSTARDRDRLRHQVLSDLGWELLRVWSPEWIKNPNAQIERIEEKLQQIQNAPPLQSPPVVTHDTAPLPATSTSTVNTPASTYDTRVFDVQPQLNDEPPSGVTYYREAILKFQGSAEQFYECADFRPQVITKALEQVVLEEGPLSLASATRRVVAAWGMSKAGTKLIRIITEAAQRAGSIHVRNGFLWPATLTQMPVRMPESGESPRPIHEICLEEIAEAAYICVRECYAITRDELIVHTARLLGYKQTGANVRGRVEEALALLQNDSRVRENDGTLALADD